jgi:L-fuconate dehydratase
MFGERQGARMNETVTGFEVSDVRFPTSEGLGGPDAVNPVPDCSAACLVLHTSDGSRGTASASPSAAETTS